MATEWKVTAEASLARGKQEHHHLGAWHVAYLDGMLRAEWMSLGFQYFSQLPGTAKSFTSIVHL